MGRSARGGETEEHRDLKRRALLWAQAQGFTACAVEGRVPRSGFRADVAACFPGRDGGAGPRDTAVFECKQARADLLRDNAGEKTTRSRLREVSARRAELERMLGLHLPSLRRGESLFAECDGYDLDAIRHDGLRKVRREEEALLTKLYAGMKFDRMRRYRAADVYYLVVAPGIIEPHESPNGWGVLEADGADGLKLARRAERVDSGAPARIALLQMIARSATRRVNADFGLTREQIEEERGKNVSA